MSRSRQRSSSDKRRGHPLVVLFLVVCLLAVLGAGARLLDRNMNRKSISEDHFDAGKANTSYARGSLILDGVAYNFYHNFENYLFFGTDGSGNENGEGASFQNAMADYILLMTIDKTAKTYSLLEINRDTMTPIKILNQSDEVADTREMQLCVAHWYGSSKKKGAENLADAVSQLLGGIRIHGYLAVPMDDIGKLNHLIGGATVTMKDDMSDEDPAMKKGATLKLSDKQAEIYLRRRMDVGGGTNEERMARQHEYVTSVLHEGFRKITSSPSYFQNILDQMGSLCLTNLTGRQLSRIAKALATDEARTPVTFRGEARDDTNLGDGILHREFYIDKADRRKVLSGIFGLERDHDVAEMTEKEDFREEDGETEMDESDMVSDEEIERMPVEDDEAESYETEEETEPEQERKLSAARTIKHK